ncbi:hypothetical protein ACFQXB_19265 [Plastorhodobacter daqingensis]|uniref:ATP-binding protein n=1 Tax=Plastorhodobacter daqingensis TaxID=1387281 RepID=A0ABW2UQW5_9RHOB
MAAAEGPWNPGLTSTIPDRLMPRATLFDPRNGSLGWEDARGLSEVVGLPPQLLATFKPSRLVLHHLLIRVTGGLHVPDGPSYSDLGINLRNMVTAIDSGYVAPALDAIAAAHARLCREAEAIITGELRDIVLARSAGRAQRSRLLEWLVGKSSERPGRSRNEQAVDYAGRWSGEDTADDLHSQCRHALARTLGAILSRRGALLVDEDIIIRVATNLVANSAGSDLVGRLVAPLFDQGAAALGYHRLPPQDDPVVLNTKGASAAGKSSIRPQQRRIAKNLGLDWRDFAIISPDYWRKKLIDYFSLGKDCKYAAMLTGQELEIIDQKLDRLLAENAARGDFPHLLVDRFRFDSFQSDPRHQSAGKLLARFGSRVYLFFLVTPPQETVVRAWRRGLETGRFKAVDDLLFHNIEAYSGMPGLFFYWALRRRKSVHYEFLDNSVARGQTPRTIAFGRDGRLVIQDIRTFCDIERFRHVNVEASDETQVIARQPSDYEAMAFVRRCCTTLDRVDFVLRGTDRIYATAKTGKIVVDPGLVPPELCVDALGDVTLAAATLGALEAGARADTIGA